eukprot:contig_34578_g8310
MGAPVTRPAFVGGPIALQPASTAGWTGGRVCRAPAGRRSVSAAGAPSGRSRSAATPWSSPRASAELATATAALTHLAEVTDTNQSSLSVTALVFFLTAWGGLSFIKGSVKDRLTQASFTLPPAT